MAKIKATRVKHKFTLPQVNMRNPKKVPRAKALAAFEAGKKAGMEELKLQTTFALFSSLRSTSWLWPNTTIRENGEIVTSPRNIVDTSALMFSQKVGLREFKTKSQIKISYSVPYAAIVHYGGVIRPYGNRFANAVIYPARPWVQAILEGTNGQKRLPVEKILRDAMTTAIFAA